jgi:hypothetical protein
MAAGLEGGQSIREMARGEGGVAPGRGADGGAGGPGGALGRVADLLDDPVEVRQGAHLERRELRILGRIVTGQRSGGGLLRAARELPAEAGVLLLVRLVAGASGFELVATGPRGPRHTGKVTIFVPVRGPRKRRRSSSSAR